MSNFHEIKNSIETDYWQGLCDLTDVFFNGRPSPSSDDAAKAERSRVFGEFVRRKTSRIRYGGKLYQVLVSEVQDDVRTEL